MNEYISREAVLSKCADIWDNADETTQAGVDTINAIDKITDFIESLPAADVQPVVHAHWVRGEEKGFRTYNPLWYCSNCGGQIRYDTRMRQYQKIKRPVWEVNAFCRKCGARMTKDGDTE